MKTRKNEESSKSKLSLQKKKETVVKKDWRNILSISHNSLNETCEFKGNSRSKEQSKCQVTVTKEAQNQVPVTVSEEARNQVTVTESSLEEARNQVVEDSDSWKKCPTCESSMPLEVFQHHVSDCLKDRFQIKGTNENEETRDKFVCQFCLKDLSYYNSTRKTQHLNKCMDQIDEMKQKETRKKKELEQARLAILDCPMCGKTLKTENGRKVHMKKCSQSLRVSTDQLLALIKQQEEERQVKLAAGEVPQAAKAGISNLNKQAKKQKLREPQSKYDEELQTALAISISLCKTASTEKTERQAKKPGKRKGGDPVPASLVVLLSEEDKQKRRSERVATMLIPQESDDDDDVESLTPVLRESQIQEKYTTGNNKLPSLWTRCELSTGGPSCLKNKDRFYVEELMPPIAVSRFVVGSSVKKMEDIPGRRKSTYQRLAEKQTVGSLGNTNLHGDTMLASTQTAVVLAELEVSAIATSDLDLTCSGFCPDSPVKVQEHTRQKMSAAYQKKMVSMVNNPDHSDVKIRTCDSTLYAHRLILSVRCPSILSNCDVDVGLTEFSTDSVLAVLKFVYAGVICLPKGSVSEIKQLATRLEIDDLVEICSSVSDNKMDEDRMERKLKDLEEERDMTDLQRMLDEEVDPGEDEGCKSEKNTQEEISNEEYNDIRCTQRKKYSVPEAGWKDGGSSEVGEDAEEDSDISEAEISLFFHDDSFNGTSGEPCGDKVGSEGHSESENMEGIKEAKVTAQGQSMRTKNVEGRGTVTRKEKDESSADESVNDMEVDQSNEGNRKDEDEGGQVEEKNQNSILYQDEDVIIYSETEDTPNCSGSEVDRRMSEVNHHQSDDLDRSGGVNSPLLVDSDGSSHNSLEEDEESDGEGSPVLCSLDSSGLDLFESPLSSKRPSAADDNQSGSQSPRIKSLAPCRENSFSSSTPPGKQLKIRTPVKVFSRGRSGKIMRRRNLDRERYETRDQQESTDPRSKGVEDHIGSSGGKSSASTNSECEDDVVSLIDDQSESNGPEIKDSSPMLLKKQPIVSPVFSLPSKERKAFRFTKTKAVTASSQKVTSPHITEKPVVICCDDEKKPLVKYPSRQHEDVDEDLIATVEDEMGMDCQAADIWEDFDDSGMGGCVITCDFPAPSFSANDSKGEGSTSMKYTNPTTDPVTPINASSVSKRKSSCDIPAVQEGEENFGDDSFDVDMVLGQVAENQNSFKTPTDGRRPRKSRKEWILPSPFTPMPEFEKMATPQLKQEVQKFGVKPVGKKRMLLLLKDVYRQTHQYETDSEFEMSVDKTVTEQNDESNPISVSDEEEISSSQDSQGSAVLEESMVAEEEEVTSSQIVSDVSELTQKISQYIHDTPDLHQRILQYEPLEFDSLKREITSAGIKCSMDKLMNFLDEKCITFTMKNRRKNSPRKRRKGSPKKGSKGSPKKGSGRGRKKTGDTE